ncbi:MAG: hypothetical protein JST68_14090, partial [Bacteroidetes bacterium]|nr:hypothetical protein [Bacteroidota bacterium]
MKNIRAKYKSSILTIAVITVCIVGLTQCVNDPAEKKPGSDSAAAQNHPTPPDRTAFAGSEACANCHKDIYDTHIHTAHYLTTRPAAETTIKCSFQPGSNTYPYDSSMIVRMEKTDSGFFQVGYYNGERKLAKRFDIIVGSGSIGQ